MTAAPDWGIVSDAELASAAAAGDRAAFAGIYDRYSNRLHDFCVGMLRDRDAAADCVHDAFCTAAVRLPQLRDGNNLRPWLYAIARNEALRTVRDRQRERVSEGLPDAISGEPGPDTLASRVELADLVAEAAGGLSDRDRAVLDLTYRHGLDGPELAEALGISATNANTLVHRLRDTVERSLGALLVARRVRSDPDACAELAAILRDWDGKFTILMRKRIARHIESCPSCDQSRRRMVSPVALLGGAPVFIPAPAWLRDRTLDRVALVSASRPIANTAEADTDAADARSAASAAQLSEPSVEDTRRRWLLAGGLVAAAFIASLGLTLLWMHRAVAPIHPADVSSAVPTPVPPAVAGLSVSPPMPLTTAKTTATVTAPVAPSRTQTASAPPPAPASSIQPSPAETTAQTATPATTVASPVTSVPAIPASTPSAPSTAPIVTIPAPQLTVSPQPSTPHYTLPAPQMTLTSPAPPPAIVYMPP